jgi:hypothetical protein
MWHESHPDGAGSESRPEGRIAQNCVQYGTSGGKERIGGYQSGNFSALCQINKTRYIDKWAHADWTGIMTLHKAEARLPSGAQATASGRQEVRCAVRFPLALPVVLSTGNVDIPALTRNISASGVLFSLDRALDVGQDVRFSMRMPHSILGTPHDVLVHCKGRVVRCSSSHNEHLAAATIDEYRFAEQ